MNSNIKNAFEETISNELISIVISNSTNKEKVSKIKIRPVILKDKIYYQISEFKGNQVFHDNNTKEEVLDKLPLWFEGLFRQAEIVTQTGQVTILISKKGNVTMKAKKLREEYVDGEDKNNSNKTILSHNKKKNYILEEGKPLPFLIDLGVMTKEGHIIKAKSDKFRQINRFLEYIEDILPNLEHDRELTILDFGCGKSYLTFVMYYYLKELKGYKIKVIGLDLKTDVIDHCNMLCEKYSYENIKFLKGDIASYQEYSSVDMVVTLHACDTATDYALYKAVSWNAKVILSVPCCQHEINRQINCEPLQTILKYGIIKERMSSLITDAVRANILETKGYRVQLLEFVDMEHTPKNILIRAIKSQGKKSNIEGTKQELEACLELLGVTPTLQRLFQHETLEEGN